MRVYKCFFFFNFEVSFDSICCFCCRYFARKKKINKRKSDRLRISEQRVQEYKLRKT